jgi:CIC family chloride channel protein
MRRFWARVARNNHQGLSAEVLAVSVACGIAAGLAVAAVQGLVVILQRLTLGFAAEHRIAIPDHSSPLRIFLALMFGALAVEVITRAMRRWVTRNPIDAVEANALRGGVMQWQDGLAVVIPILASVGFGASVGIEAAVTQIGAVVASLMGRQLKFPRSDLRLVVGAGAAAAIAAAYRAPIAGMLYSYELVLGSYTKRTLVPVALAAITALGTVEWTGGMARPFLPRTGAAPIWADYPTAVGIGIVAALVGIGTMVLVGGFERLLAHISRSDTTRRLLVSVILAAIAWRFPAVLGSGHAGIDAAVNGDVRGREALGLAGAKGLASALSLAGGFRGGLFSASLLLGGLLGQVVAWISQVVPWIPVANPTLCAMVGMAAVGASIIGSPLAMAFLVLESTGDYEATLVVAVGTVVSAYVTDRLFGYSFATWRFQQRGLALEGGHDVSRLMVTPIGALIRPPKTAVLPETPYARVESAFSVAGSKGVAVIDRNGIFCGLVDAALIEVVHEADGPLPITAIDLVDPQTQRLTPKSSLADAVQIFRSTDRATLPVVEEGNSQRLLGVIRSSDAFRQATVIADAQRREELGLSRGDP